MQGIITNELLNPNHPLIKNQINDKEVKGSPLPKFARTEIGP